MALVRLTTGGALMGSLKEKISISVRENPVARVSIPSRYRCGSMNVKNSKGCIVSSAEEKKPNLVDLNKRYRELQKRLEDVTLALDEILSLKNLETSVDDEALMEATIEQIETKTELMKVEKQIVEILNSLL